MFGLYRGETSRDCEPLARSTRSGPPPTSASPAAASGSSILSLANSAARGAGATLGGQALRFLIQLASVAILARLLSPDDYGLVAMVVSIVGVATILGDFGLSMAAIQKQDLTDGQRNNLFWTNAVIGLVTAGAVFLLAEPLALFYGQAELVDITRAVSITFLLSSLTPQFRAEVATRLRFKAMAAADVLAQAVALCLAVVVALSGGGYWALVTQQLTIAALTLAVLGIFSGWRPGLPRRGEQMRSLYKYGANTLGVQLITYTTSNIDNVLIGRVWGADALGLYTRAYQIFRLPLAQIAAPMTRVALPILSRLQNDERYEPYLHRAQILLTYCFGGLFFLLAAFADPAIEILLGPDWDEAKPIFAILAIGGVFQALGYTYYWIFLSRAFTGLQLKYSLIGRGLMIAMMAVGVIWGPIGVAIGSTAGQIAMWALNTVFAIPKTGVRVCPLLRLTIRPLIIYCGMLAIALPLAWFLIDGWNPWLQVLVLGASVSCYLGLVALVHRPFRSDIALIWDAVRRTRKSRD